MLHALVRASLDRLAPTHSVPRAVALAAYGYGDQASATAELLQFSSVRSLGCLHDRSLRHESVFEVPPERDE